MSQRTTLRRLPVELPVVLPAPLIIWTRALALPLSGRFLIRLCDLVGELRGRPGPFFRLPGRGGHVGEPATKWGGRGRPVGHAATRRCHRRCRADLCPWPGRGGRFFFRGVVSEISG
jgi:hypothetical protein